MFSFNENSKKYKKSILPGGGSFEVIVSNWPYVRLILKEYYKVHEYHFYMKNNLAYKIDQIKTINQ